MLLTGSHVLTRATWRVPVPSQQHFPTYLTKINCENIFLMYFSFLSLVWCPVRTHSSALPWELETHLQLRVVSVGTQSQKWKQKPSENAVQPCDSCSLMYLWHVCMLGNHSQQWFCQQCLHSMHTQWKYTWVGCDWRT